MRKQILLFIICILSLFVISVHAEDITFTLDQKEYYFLIGQQAIIPLTLNNTYGSSKAGQLQYTITQEVNQNGFVYSSSNSNSQRFTVEDGNNTININFGSTDQPLTLKVSITFKYEESGERSVNLNDIIIHFVSNQSQMNNQQNQQTSSSEEIIDAQPSQKQQQTEQTPQQKLQNNQLSQDSSALKEQIQQQIAEQQHKEQAFQETLQENSEFQEHQQDLENKGYNLTDTQLNAASNNTGSFNYTYENQQGEQATLQGTMQEGVMEEIYQQTAEDRQEMFENLNQSQQYQEFQEQLQSEGYNATNHSFQQNGNKTTLDITYENKENETAVIHAEFENNELQKVELEKKEHFPFFLILLPFIIIGCMVLIWLYLKKKKQSNNLDKLPHITSAPPFDYKKESQRLLEQSKKYFQHHQYKDAYGTAGQALRLYLSYKYGLKKELTNDEVLNFLRKQKKPHQTIKKCFSYCSLVEFAKYQANEHDFNEIVTTVGNTINH